MKQTYGQRLQAFRKRADLTIHELAAKTDLSPSFISKIETGKVGVSVSNLDKIASAIGLSVGHLVRDQPDKTMPQVVKRNRGDRFVLNENILYERISPDNPSFHLSSVLVRSQPGDTSGEMTTHVGDEFRYILMGTFRFWVGEMVYELETGDTLSHTADLPHRWENIGSDEGVFLVVGTMPFV